MFKVSRRLDYGLQMLIALANLPDEAPISTASLAEKLDIPLPFLHQIGHTLMQTGLIKASPGPRGGLRLSRSASAITVAQIAEALEGPVSLSPCQTCEDNCARKEFCTSHSLWDDLEKKILDHLAGITLEALLEPIPVDAQVYAFPETAKQSNSVVR